MALRRKLEPVQTVELNTQLASDVFKLANQLNLIWIKGDYMTLKSEILCEEYTLNDVKLLKYFKLSEIAYGKPLGDFELLNMSLSDENYIVVQVQYDGMKNGIEIKYIIESYVNPNSMKVEYFLVRNSN